ncbi:MAG: glycoside hydrolase family 71/99-like protein [Planctomycetota bacterium]
MRRRFGPTLATPHSLLAACLCFVSSLLVIPASGEETKPDQRSRPLILAHYMPWHESLPHSGRWGWHWTMNHFNPSQMRRAPDGTLDDRRQLASHFYPLAGCYDSGDLDLLEYHLQLMKLAGIDGVIVDWYGLTSFRDYGTLHRNTMLLVQVADRMGMKVAICYEDQTVPALVKAGRIGPGDQDAHVVKELSWLLKNWSTLQGYVRLDGRPVLLSFGHAGLSDEQWTDVIAKLDHPVAYFSEHHQRDAAVGAFDWPIPDQGVQQTVAFNKRSNGTPNIPVAFPRFVDIYQEAGVGDGYREIADANGNTFRETFRRAIESKSPIVQIATWNDWGEGTVIEPSQEFGYRDLELIQETIGRTSTSRVRYGRDDLRLPLRLYLLRKSRPDLAVKLNQVATSLNNGDVALARRQLKSPDFLDEKTHNN